MNYLKFSDHIIVEKGLSPYIFAKCIEVAKITLELVNALTSHSTVTDWTFFFSWTDTAISRGEDMMHESRQPRRIKGSGACPVLSMSWGRRRPCSHPSAQSSHSPGAEQGWDWPLIQTCLCAIRKGAPYLLLATGVLELDITWRWQKNFGGMT